MDDPRGFQLGQLRRRYPGMKASETDQATVVTFDLMPSDPDFPYTMDSLACKMMIPLTFPKSSPPTLRVTNPDMKRGFQLNVENGFDEIISNAPNATLLTVMNRLDRSLADLLARPMMDTIKIQPNNATRDISASATASVVHAQVRVDPIVSQPEPSIADKERAKTKRQTDIRQLVSRLGKLPKFKQSVDGISFTIPFTPARKAEVPPSLVNLETICLIVPELYNLQPCRIDIPGNKDESFQNVERSFEEHCRAHPSTTLLAQINYLTQHLATMAKKKVMGGPSVPIQAPPSMPVGPSIPVPSRSTDSQQTILIDRPHVQIIPRPPEWSQQDDESSDSGGDDSSDEGVENTASDDDGKEDDGGVPTTLDLSSRGIIVSLPGLELHGIELLELDTLSLTVKCERCKTQVDVEKLRNEVAKSTDCTKCGNRIDATFRKDLMHINANRAGSVDTAGAIITDMLPSAFVPTCSGCSTRHATPPCLAVRGDTTVAFCRECHQKMSFRLPEVRFMLASLTNEKRSRVVARKQPKEQLGIVAGQELPRRGRCKHYTKSYRWFRSVKSAVSGTCLSLVLILAGFLAAPRSILVIGVTTKTKNTLTSTQTECYGESCHCLLASRLSIEPRHTGR